MRHTSFLHGIQDENPLNYAGWEERTEELGHNPSHTGGTDYRGSQHTIIARLNNGYAPNGTIPTPDHYEEFAVRVQNFVKASQGCDIWVIGNEMNKSDERPHGQPIYPTDYARCYDMCRTRIRALPGHEYDQVLIGAVAPYNNQTVYPGNESGDWVKYFADVIAACSTVGGITLHCYGEQQTPSDPSSDAKMGGGFTNRHRGFRAYRDFLSVVPEALRYVPLYITETNPGARGTPWQNANTGWVQAAYSEINDWNKANDGQEIRALVLYCWNRRGDGMYIDGKPGVHDDFYKAVERGYRWEDELSVTPPIEPPKPEPPDPPTGCWTEEQIRAFARDEIENYTWVCTPRPKN